MGSNPTLSAAALLALAILSGCQPQSGPAPRPAGSGAPTLAEDLAAIQKVRDEYVAAHNAGDLDRIMALWSDDAVFMPTDEPTIFGRAAIRGHLEEILDQIPGTVALSLEETRVLGDWAFDRGVETITMGPDAAGRQVTMRIKYLCLLQRQKDGAWKFARYIYNYEESPPAPS